MRILFVLSSMPVGGVEVFTLNLAEGLLKKGNETAILIFRTPKEGLKLLTKEASKISLSNRQGKFNFLFLINAHKQIKAFKPDIILSLSDFTYFFIELLQKLTGRRTPHIIAFHSLKPYSFKDKALSKLFLFFSKLWKGYYLFISHNHFALSQAYYNLTEERSFIIHNGVDINFFTPANKKIDEKSLSIIHIANIRPEKDQWTLIKALEVLDKNLKDWKLLFIGKDKINLLNSFKGYLQENGLLNKVTFIENIDRISLKNFLSASDIFILTSFSEVLPISALEAMSMRLPCVLTDVGGCPEIITDGYNGYLVKPKDHQAIADKLLFLFKNPQFVKQMGENARKTVLEKFSLELCAKKYIEMFNEVISNDR